MEDVLDKSIKTVNYHKGLIMKYVFDVEIDFKRDLIDRTDDSRRNMEKLHDDVYKLIEDFVVINYHVRWDIPGSEDDTDAG